MADIGITNQTISAIDKTCVCGQVMRFYTATISPALTTSSASKQCICGRTVTFGTIKMNKNGNLVDY